MAQERRGGWVSYWVSAGVEPDYALGGCYAVECALRIHISVALSTTLRRWRLHGAPRTRLSIWGLRVRVPSSSLA